MNHLNLSVEATSLQLNLEELGGDFDVLSCALQGESAAPRITRHDGVIVNNRVDVQRPDRVVFYYCSEGTDWYFQNGTVVPEFSSDSGSLYQYQESGGDSRILYFNPFTSILQGYYFCFKNSGSSMIVSHVGVFSTLNLAPTNLTFVSDIDAGSIQMRWSVETGPGPLDYYTVKAGPLEYEIDKESPTLVVDPDVLVGQGNADSVQFTVSASYAGYFYTTKESILIVNGPSNVDVTMATTSSITVEWTEYSNHIPELVTVMGFVVEYKKVSEQQFDTSDTLVQSPVEITGLSPETKYQIRVLPVLADNVTMTTTGPFLSQIVEASTLVLNETSSPEPPPRVPVSANSMNGGVIGAVVVAIGVIIVGIVCIVIIVLLLLRRRNSLKNIRMTIRTCKTSPSVESNLANGENGLPFQNAPLKPYVGQQKHDIGPNRDDTAITLKSFHSSQMECEECDDGESGDSGCSDRETVSECTTAVPVRRDYANINLDPDENDVHCIDMYKFPEYVKEMHQQRQHGFERQYEELCRETEFLPYSSNVARASRIKNRFNNIFTFDHSRVVLETPDQFGSNYINASYINGHERTRAYISAQGPIPETIADFWLMVWEQRSPVIVMLTKVEERGRKKCEQYWLQGLGVSYDVGRQLLVSMEGYKLYAECEVREFSLTNLSHPDVPAHKVTHFLFTGWPDHGVPQHPSSLLRFIQKVRAAYGRQTAPMIVHCSAGVGRSGTFIAIDSLVQRLKTMDTVNIYGFIRDMRHCRTHMVQTLDQYAFIHDSLFDYIVCGDTSIPASQLKSKIKELKMIHPDKGKTTLHEEYQLLNAVSMSPSEEDSRLSERAIISKKNRYADKYPYAQKYLYLLGRSATRGSEYINASFVNSYCNDNEFIAAQSPMENTVDDVWQLVWQFRCSVIVNLCRREEERENMCARFWPDGKTQYDHITVKTVNKTDKEDYTVHKHHVSDGLRQSTVLEVNHFHYQNWPKDGRPNINTLIMMIAEVMKVKQGRQRPMLVMCDDGMDRTGTFICIASEIEHTKLEGTLDVFQSVKLGRCQRPHLVSSQENYFLCYETLQAYIESFDGYANFKDI